MKTDSYLNFWRNVEDILILNELTLKDLSKMTDVPYTTLYYQYKHQSKPDIEFVSLLANYFNLSIEQLLYSKIVGDFSHTDEELDNDENYQNSHLRVAVNEMLDATAEGIETGDNNINDDTGLIKIPFVPQKISAGYGEELLNPEDVEIQTINIMEDLARGVPRDSLLAARVKGDSMIDVYIYPDDIVVFAKGIISGDGIYVLSIDNEVMVKRLVFDRLNHSVLIISENKKYPQREAKDDNQSLRILGKVVGWIHANSV